jgi:hypothetical protein
MAIQHKLIPITRKTPGQRLSVFLDASNDLYNKFSPYDDYTPGVGIGAQQPYVWIKPSDSSTTLNLIKYDTQAVPIGSTIRDEQRLTKFLTSGTGLLYIGKQFLLQQQTAFNETRIYNPLSVLSAAAQQGSTGLIERPTRYIEGGLSMGGLVNMAASLIGQTPISAPMQGVASAPVSPYAGVGLGDAGKGYMHLQTGQAASNRFGLLWPIHDVPSSGGGFLQQLGASLLKTARNLIPSTLPFGIGTSDTSLWTYRPEYPNALNGSGVYEIFHRDSAGFLRYTINGITYGVGDVAPYYPNELGEAASTDMWYDAAPSNNPDIDSVLQNGKLTVLYAQLSQLAPDRFTYNGNYIGGGIGRQPVAARRPLREQSQETIADNYVKNLGKNGSKPDSWTDTLTDPLTLVARKFSSAPLPGSAIGQEDTYNTSDLITTSTRMPVSSSAAPKELTLDDGVNSTDIIFFYFYDLVNNVYIPFRATIAGLNDLHTPEWDEIAYIGRADKLYVYKGFTHDVNFSFTVYANSLKEMLPMWKRINYLVGLARPTKYTSGSDLTKSFMYPPMVTFRIGDMYVDQPAVLKSIGVNIPEDATWETQRGTVFTYLKGSGVDLSGYNQSQIMYQLPKKVDMTINMSLMEKARSLVSDDHFFVSPQIFPEIQQGGLPPPPGVYPEIQQGGLPPPPNWTNPSVATINSNSVTTAPVRP